MLAILRRGESVARQVIIDEAFDCGIVPWLPEHPERCGNKPIDALQLGLCFRLLALALTTLLALASGLNPGIRHTVASRYRPLPNWRQHRTLLPHDTS